MASFFESILAFLAYIVKNTWISCIVLVVYTVVRVFGKHYFDEYLVIPLQRYFGSSGDNLGRKCSEAAVDILIGVILTVGVAACQYRPKSAS
ncbi:hypothetical protein LTR15_002135 [Elasticomyces elasticus]|nr:hypothetical protein LTR15_002135 [Elasticomyces elasticus]